jgi:hypothetical protein
MWRLIHGLDTDHAEEVVLRMQGVMCHKTLPPIKYPFQMYVKDNLDRKPC